MDNQVWVLQYKNGKDAYGNTCWVPESTLVFATREEARHECKSMNDEGKWRVRCYFPDFYGKG